MATKNFKSLDSLQSVEKVINEASTALKSKTNTIVNSAIPETLAGALGAGIGGVGSFAALFYGGSVVGLSAAGISSGLAAAGAVVGGGMAAGIFVLAAPIVVLGAGGVGIASSIKNKKLKEAKDRLLKLAIEKNHAINKALKEEINATKDRADYLNSINILLQRAINDLKADLGV
ncbi:MAG: hypothetical protein ACOX0T_09665 [Pelotomaculum sp.]|jgi:hypothetical protein